jgi:FkbM family methyltransferase
LSDIQGPKAGECADEGFFGHSVQEDPMKSIRSLVRATYHLIPFKAPVFKVLRRHVVLPERVYRHLHFQAPVDIDVSGERSFKTHHYGYQVENDLFWAGFGNGWEGTSLKLWVRLAKQVDTVLDIGANTGVFALAAQAVNPHAQVYAFEPVKRVHERLLENIALNQFEIEAVLSGVSNRNGEAVIYDTPSDHVYSASLNKEMLSDRSDVIETRIGILRIDDFLADKSPSGTLLVKIDTERHEAEVFEGFGNLIQTYRPSFLVEILDRSLGQGIESFFAGQDYLYYEVEEGTGIRRVSELGHGERNYLICTPEVANLSSLGDGVQHGEL